MKKSARLFMLALLAVLTCCMTVVALACVLAASSDGGLGALVGGGGGSGDFRTVSLSYLKGSERHSPPIVTKAGKQAFEVVLRKGKLHGEGSNADFRMRSAGYFPTDQARVRFKLWFDDAFDWTASSSHKVGGKLAGFDIGEGKASGGEYSKQAGSFRLTFAENREGRGYLYPQLRSDYDVGGGQITWERADQSSGFRAVSGLAKGIHVFADGGMRFRSGQWNDVEMFIRLNTVGRYDGVIEMNVNGTRRRLTNARFRYTDIKITGFRLVVFFGGGDLSYAPSQDIRLWYSDFAFSKT